MTHLSSLIFVELEKKFGKFVSKKCPQFGIILKFEKNTHTQNLCD